MDNYKEEKKNINNELPAVVIRGLVPIPHNDFRIEVGRSFSVEALKLAEKNNYPYVLVLLQKNFFSDKIKILDIEKFGVLAKIITKVKISNDIYKVKFHVVKRIKIKKFVKTSPLYLVEYNEVKTLYGDLKDEKVLIKMVIQEISNNSHEIVGNSDKNLLEQFGQEISSEKLTDLIIFCLRIDESHKYKYLKECNLNKRLFYILNDIASHMFNISIEQKINDQVRRSIDENQKEFYLREKMRAIQNELGEKVKKEEEIEELRNKIKISKMPNNIKEKAFQELSRYQSSSSLVAEYFVIRTYLDFLISLPWKKFSKDVNDLKKIQDKLDINHYGLKKVKERIIEYAAVKIMTKKNPQTILCLSGPPGVGKTSLAISISEALGRKFVKQSLGGLKEESEIRGHRKTYVGAMPGRILNGLKEAGTMNPVFLLDEIDKLVFNNSYDPSSALMEVLDPKQNKTFMDNYLSEPFDLSQVLFITTANYLENISAPLRDRLEIVELNSYTEQDKFMIAKNHLISQQIKSHGLDESQFEIDDSSIFHIIRHYTKEAGVRELNKKIADLVRKTVKEILINKKEKVIINKENIEFYLGKPIYFHTLANIKEQIGIANGLAYTSFGGDILPVEVTYYKGKGQLILTGKLGQVIKESAMTALSFLKSHAKEFEIDFDIFNKNDFHIHLPEGAIPKDGPSAGITIATSIISAVKKRYIRKDIGMTGEITLNGTILPIGGLKEKAIAANRSGLNTILIPKDNLKDIDDIPEEVLKVLEIILVDNINDVFIKALV
ncbi:endopeptidase La [Candidatus Phytoplasma prunorum]|uniref:endopeptidase La n=1 Tax=Candidatus Phytoplasma prunorum TaxID=47565 RepID=UPI002FEF7616